jgi:CheY-like chemotaxis protein
VLVAAMHPDIVLLDLVLSGLSGVQTARRLRDTPPDVRSVRAAHCDGRRVIAVGTTVVRTLEFVAEGRSGWTDLVVTPERELPRWVGCSPVGTSRRRHTC